MRALCHGVTALLSVSIGFGCYEQHVGVDPACSVPLGHVCCDASGAPRPAPAVCPFECPAGTQLIGADVCFAGSADAAPPRDAGPSFYDAAPRVDAGPAISCPEVRADFACLDSLTPTAGQAFDLPVRFDTCGCCPDVACATRVEPRTGRIFLTTGLCAERGDCFCDACTVPQVDCPVPALEAGTWDVVVNGGEAFELDVREAPSGPPSAACFSFAEPDRCRATPSIEAEPIAPDEVCIERVRGRDYRLRVRRACGTCHQLRGPCVTAIEDSGPREHTLIAAAFSSESSCDIDCPAACIESVRYCELPPLRFGDSYRLRVAGQADVVFEHGAETPVCMDGPGDDAPPGR